MKKSLKALVCITTCNRLKEVKKYVLPYIRHCNQNENYDFLLALDGPDGNYLDFCTEYSIPLLYSDQREGVGVSKNRVLEKFPDYDYYFFVEDDIELMDSKIFALHIEAVNKTNYHHFSTSGILDQIKKEYVSDSITIIHAKHGGGTFNFFTAKGIHEIGGWHDAFAEYKRYGHVEHTLRFRNAGLSPSPFLFIEKAQQMILIHDPDHVSSPVAKYKGTIFSELEYNLVQKKLKHYPIKTLSNYYFNGFRMDFNDDLQKLLNSKKRYPFLSSRDKRKALSDHHLVLTKQNIPSLERRKHFFKFILYDPFGKKVCRFLKHRINVYLKRIFSKNDK